MHRALQEPFHRLILALIAARFAARPIKADPAAADSVPVCEAAAPRSANRQ